MFVCGIMPQNVYHKHFFFFLLLLLQPAESAGWIPIKQAHNIQVPHSQEHVL